MKTLKTLVRETKNLSKYVDRSLPKEVSQAWLWEAQNAFLAQSDPATNQRWKDRHGIAYGKGLKKVGNIEAYLSYGKLHRTGKLLRNLYGKVERSGTSRSIILGNRVKYAEDHNEGLASGKIAKIKAPYVRGGANTVVTGGRIVARPFMNPSRKVLMMPKTLLNRKMKSFGWTSY